MIAGILAFTIALQTLAVWQAEQIARARHETRWRCLAAAVGLVAAQRIYALYGVISASPDDGHAILWFDDALLAVSGLLVAALFVLERRSVSETPDRAAGALPDSTSIDSIFGRLARRGIATGAFMAAGIAVVGVTAYSLSKAEIVEGILSTSLIQAQAISTHLEHALEHAPEQTAGRVNSAIAEIEQIWAKSPRQYSCTNLYILDKDGRLLVDTSHLKRVGELVEFDLTGSRDGSESIKIQQLLEESRDWVGYFTASDGVDHIAAFTSIDSSGWLVAIHVPVYDIGPVVRSAMLPWMAGAGLILLIVIPAAGGLFFGALRSSRKQMKKSEEERQHIVVASHALLVSLDRRGRITAVSAAAARFLGYDSEELIGRPLNRFRPTGIRRRDMEAYAAIRDEKPAISQATELIHKNGERIFCNFSLFPTFNSSGEVDGAEAMATDITPLMEALDELRVKERSIQHALTELESQKFALDAHSIVVITDTKGRVTYVNDKFCEVSQYSREELIGQPHAITNSGIHPKAFFKDLWDTILDGRVWRGEITNRAKDGRLYWVDSTIVPFRDRGGKITQFVAIHTDVTQRKQAQIESALLESRLRQAQKLETIGVLASGIAHDLNNMLTPILGHAELAKDQLPADSEVQADLDHISEAALRAKDLTRQILSFSRDSKYEVRPVYLPDTVKEALGLLRSTLPVSIDIRQDIDENCPLVMADATQIHQIVLNLCANASHAMRDRPGTLQVNLDQVRIDPEFRIEHPDLAPGPYVRLSVEDTGHGMDSVTMEKIYDPFFTTKGVGEGTGLGLSVVHGIVASHNGAITIRSEVGKGTTISVYLPVTEEIAHDTGPEVTDVQCRGNERVLLVDDVWLVAETNRRILERFGYRVISFLNSAECLKAFETDPDGFDIVVTDYTMKEMTGVQMSEKMLAVRPRVPIILCTGMMSGMDIKEARRCGIREIVLKPYESRELVRAVRRAIDGAPDSENSRNRG